MEVLAEAKLEYREDTLEDRLVLIVKFKVPNKFLKVKRIRTLCDRRWLFNDYYANYGEYQDDLLSWVGDTERIIKEAEDVVKEYIKGEAADLVKDRKETEFRRKLKESKKIIIKVNIDEQGGV